MSLFRMTPEQIQNRLRQVDDMTLIQLSIDVLDGGSGYLRIDSSGAITRLQPADAAVRTPPTRPHP